MGAPFVMDTGIACTVQASLSLEILDEDRARKL
jgi:hypothetical protein